MSRRFGPSAAHVHFSNPIGKPSLQPAEMARTEGVLTASAERRRCSHSDKSARLRGLPARQLVSDRIVSRHLYFVNARVRLGHRMEPEFTRFPIDLDHDASRPIGQPHIVQFIHASYDLARLNGILYSASRPAAGSNGCRLDGRQPLSWFVSNKTAIRRS